MLCMPSIVELGTPTDPNHKPTPLILLFFLAHVFPFARKMSHWQSTWRHADGTTLETAELTFIVGRYSFVGQIVSCILSRTVRMDAETALGWAL